MKEKRKDIIAEYYDSVADNYRKQYSSEDLSTAEKYPQNYCRLQLLAQRIPDHAQKVYEIGTGEGTPLAILARMGYEVYGCDISENMVGKTKQNLQSAGVNDQNVQVANVEDILTFSNQLALGPYDALVAFGVMPHVKKDLLVLRNMRRLIKKEGKVFIEFRNKLFSLFTFNRLTKEFILDDLLEGVSPDLKNLLSMELDKRVNLNLPEIHQPDSGPSYDLIPAKYHNPFEVVDLLAESGFVNPKIHWYHYHAAPPCIETENRALYWEESMKLEHSSSWRGYFLCSAFVVEADAC